MKAWPLAALVLLGCTGQNVDENFVSTHGALLARIECQFPFGAQHRYDAMMFLDGSVLATASGMTQFHERSDTDRAHARIQVSEECTAGMSDLISIESGHVQYSNCESSGGVHFLNLLQDMAVSSCTGFNQTLFD